MQDLVEQRKRYDLNDAGADGKQGEFDRAPEFFGRRLFFHRNSPDLNGSGILPLTIDKDIISKITKLARYEKAIGLTGRFSLYLIAVDRVDTERFVLRKAIQKMITLVTTAFNPRMFPVSGAFGALKTRNKGCFARRINKPFSLPLHHPNPRNKKVRSRSHAPKNARLRLLRHNPYFLYRNAEKEYAFLPKQKCTSAQEVFMNYVAKVLYHGNRPFAIANSKSTSIKHIV